MTGCEANPLNLWDLCNDVDQIREIRRVFIISFTPVGVYILAQEMYFSRTLLHVSEHLL